MFNKYYYTIIGEEVIVYAAKTKDDHVEMSLYTNEVLSDRETGLIGEFELYGTEMTVLKIKNKALKSTHELTIDGRVEPLKSIKIKPLRERLTQLGIHNELNPTKEEIEQTRFKKETLLIPIALMIIGFTIQYFVQGMSGSIRFLPYVPEGIAGWILYDVVSERLTWIKDLRRARIGFMALVIVAISLLGEFLFGLL